MTTQPQWIEKVLDIYGAGIGHAFILHFNVNDYVSPESPISPVAYLSKTLARYEVIAVYSRDRGITFPVDSMKKKALDILGLGQKQQAPANPTLAALQSIGAAQAPQDQELPKNPSAALPLLDQLLRYSTGDNDRNVVVIIENAEFIAPDGPLASMSPDDRTALAMMTRWGRDPEIINSGNPVFLMAGNLSSLHQDLRAASNRYEAIEVSLPDNETRRQFIRRYVSEKKIKLAEGLTVEMVANSTAMLSLLHIEDVLLRAIRQGRLTQALVWERKNDIIKGEFGDILEVFDPKFGFTEIGGLDHIKGFFQKSVISPILKSNFMRVPMGILMTGPAGCGKTIMAEAVAKESGLNCVRLMMSKIVSKWQGEGERNLDKALRAILSLAPVIVFVDEIDQAIQRGNGSGGSQQDQRIFQRLLEFMSDTSHRGQVVFLAATNRPDLMDAALKRPGRFDKKIPFLVPDEAERESIFRVMARRYLGQECEIRPVMIEATNGWTGAEIEAVAVKAAELAEDEGYESCQALEVAVSKLSPSTADIELMTMLAIREVSDKDLLPPKYQNLMTNREELDRKVETLKEEGVNRTGRSLL